MTNPKKKLAEYSYSYDLNFYFNCEEIKNIDMLFATFDYFETGERQGVFATLDFLNLLFKQYDLLRESFETPIDFLQHLKKIPLTEIQRHILYGFLLKWFGGYPIEESMRESNLPQEVILRFIEREFLKYEGETPEKKFCQKDWIEYARNKQIEKMINELLNPGLSQKEFKSPDNNKRLKWKAGPSYLGHLIDELERNGYIELPIENNNEKNAEFLLTIFDLISTPGTLAKELSENSNSLAVESKGKITIKPIPKGKRS
jgi:hypothetical protein